MEIFTKINIVIAFVMLMANFNVFGCKVRSKPSEHSMKLSNLIWRANRDVLLTEDFDLIDRYLNQEVQMSDESMPNDQNFPVYTFMQVIATNQLDQDYLKQFKSLAVNIKEINQAESKKIEHLSYLEDIIWWSEARGTEDLTGIIELNETGGKTARTEDIMALLIERGKVDELKNWQTKVSFKKSDLMFELAIRKAKMVNLFRDLPIDFVQQLENEFIKSMSEIFPILTEGSWLGKQHLQWLFIEMGKNIDMPEVKTMLMNLKKQPLYYNQKQLMLADIKATEFNDYEGIDDVKKIVIERLDIIPFTLEALNPENPNSSRSYYGCM